MEKFKLTTKQNKYNIGDIVYSRIYREADKGLVTAIVYRHSKENPVVFYQVLFEDGSLHEETDLTLSTAKTVY